MKGKGKGRGRGFRGRGSVSKRRKPRKKGPPPVIAYKKWPIFAPRNMLAGVVAAGAVDLLILACAFYTVDLAFSI